MLSVDRRSRGALVIGVALALGLFVPARADLLEQRRRLEILSLPVPEKLDLARKRKGRSFSASYAPDTAEGRVPLRLVHSWKLKVLGRSGKPLENATVRVEGTMPQHQHPMPSLPVVKQLAKGEFLLSGMKFHMPGWWVVTITVEAGERSEEIQFNLML